jgi:hypothetical protein
MVLSEQHDLKNDEIEGLALGDSVLQDVKPLLLAREHVEELVIEVQEPQIVRAVKSAALVLVDEQLISNIQESPNDRLDQIRCDVALRIALQPLQE